MIRRPPRSVGAVRHAATRSLAALPHWARTLVLAIWRAPQYLLIGLFRLWRLLVSPLYGPTCKYYPSCSAYGLEAVRRHGAVRGVVLTGWRLLRCNPWSQGGIDDVPPARNECGHEREHAREPADAAGPDAVRSASCPDAVDRTGPPTDPEDHAPTRRAA